MYDNMVCCYCNELCNRVDDEYIVRGNKRQYFHYQCYKIKVNMQRKIRENNDMKFYNRSDKNLYEAFKKEDNNVLGH